MERVIFVEVLGCRGDVVQRVRLERLPATIGRGYECDVIVGDPLVEAQHARLGVDEQGRVVLEDLGSVNGLFADGARRPSARVVVEGVTTARIGRTLLRVVPQGASVPAAIRDTETGDRLSALLAAPRWSGAVLVVGFAVTVFVIWLGSFERRAASVAGGEALSLVLLSALWAGFWAAVGRANVQRFSFWPHLALTWVFLLTVGAIGLAAGYLEFLYPAGPFGGIAILAALALAAALLARHLGLATLLTRRRRNTIAAATTAAVFGLVLLAGRIASDQLAAGTVPMTASVKPFPVRLVPATGLETFLKTSDELKKEIDGLTDAK